MAVEHPDVRVTVFTPGEIFGGAERQALTLMDALRDEGVQPELIVFHDADLARRARESGYPTFVLPARRGFDLDAIRALRRHLDATAGQVISVHGYRACIYLGIAAARGRFRVVKTEHGHVEHDHFPLLQRMKQKLYRFAENRAMARLGAEVVYVTRDLQARCRREHRRLGGRVIHNGIAPLAGSTQRPSELQQAAFNLVIVGRLERIKGIEWAMRALQDPRVPANALLHIVGDGAERAALERLAGELGLPRRVLFHGFRANSYDFIGHADALLMPSLHEGLPYTVLEAMSLQTPIIASAVGGLAEVLTHERTALLVRPCDASAIAAAVALLHADCGLRDALRREALREVQTRLSARRMAREYLQAFAGR